MDHQCELDLPTAAYDEAAAFLRAHQGGPERGPLVGLHAGGAGLSGLKRWPAPKFAALAIALRERWNARIMLLGGPDEVDVAGLVAASMGVRPIIAAGAVPLLTSMALLTTCDLFVGNDSGLLHAAAALGTPYIGIYGPTCVTNFHPIAAYQGQGIVIQPSPPCLTVHPFVGGAPIWSRSCCRDTCRALTTITINDVLAAADVLLQHHSAGVKAGQRSRSWTINATTR